MFKICLFSVLVGLLSSVSFAQGGSDVQSEAREVLAAGEPEAVEQLINLASQSVNAAAVVIELVAKSEPRMLAELMQVLSTIMNPADFSRAVEVAMARLGAGSDAQILVAELKAEINAAPSLAKGDTEVSADYEQSTVHQRRTESPGVIEDGSDGSSGDPSVPGIPGVPNIFNQILEALGIDPPASPS